MSNLEHLTAKLANIDSERAVLQSQYLQLQNKLHAIHEQRAPLIAEISNLRKIELLSDKEPRWELLLDGTDDTTHAAYSEIVNSYQFLWAGGQFVENNQRVISLKFDRNDQTQVAKAVKVLTQIIPACKPLDVDGKKTIIFEIFEHTLGEFGAYALHLDVAHNLKPSLVRRYSRPVQFETLESALKYIQQTHYYSDITPLAAAGLDM